MKYELFQALISEVTKSAYQNYNDWMQSDVNIASQIRDGIRMARSAFGEIKHQSNRTEVLKEMKIKVQNCLQYYRSLPGDAGTWECSALNIIEREINRLKSDK